MKKIRLYKYVILHNSQITKFTLNPLLDFLDSLNTTERLRQILHDVKIADYVKVANYGYFNGFSYRNHKPYLGSKYTDDKELIERDIHEDCLVFFDTNNSILGVEYNHFGMKTSHIITYLNSYLNDGFRIIVVPISSENSIDLWSGGILVKKIAIQVQKGESFGAFGTAPDRLKDALKSDFHWIVNYLDVVEDSNSQLSLIEFSVGKRKSDLNIMKLPLLLDILSDSESIRSLKITTQSGNDRQEIDLKNRKLFELSVKSDEYGELQPESLISEYEAKKDVVLSLLPDIEYMGYSKITEEDYLHAIRISQ